jgi:hypothetical protein
MITSVYRTNAGTTSESIRAILLLLCLALPSLAAQDTFANPLLPSGADPWSIHKDGWYYYTHTTGRNITLFKSKSIAELASAERKVVWTPPPDQPYSKEPLGARTPLYPRQMVRLLRRRRRPQP